MRLFVSFGNGSDCRAVTDDLPRDRVGELTLQARSSPDVNQTSGVSVRMSISNYETLVANAVRRVHRGGRAIDPELARDAWTERDPLSDRERNSSAGLRVLE